MSGKPDIEIRLFGDTDSISELTNLLNSAYKQLDNMGFRYVATWQDDEITLKRIKDSSCYIAVLDGNLVGSILYKAPGKGRGSEWYERNDVAYFGQFGVWPEFQKRGIGGRLLDFVEKQAAETGASEIACDTAKAASHLIEMYENRGYRIAGEIDWPVTNYVSVILSKNLLSLFN